MRIQLVGLYADGSNIQHLDKSVILEREAVVGSGADRDTDGALQDIFAAQEAVENAYSTYASTIIRLVPDAA